MEAFPSAREVTVAIVLAFTWTPWGVFFESSTFHEAPVPTASSGRSAAVSPMESFICSAICSRTCFTGPVTSLGSSIRDECM
jgi:hypothetical protein